MKVNLIITYPYTSLSRKIVQKIAERDIKTGFPLEFTPHTMRSGNDKYCFRNKNYLLFIIDFELSFSATVNHQYSIEN